MVIAIEALPGKGCGRDSGMDPGSQCCSIYFVKPMITWKEVYANSTHISNVVEGDGKFAAVPGSSTSCSRCRSELDAVDAVSRQGPENRCMKFLEMNVRSTSIRRVDTKHQWSEHTKEDRYPMSQRRMFNKIRGESSVLHIDVDTHAEHQAWSLGITACTMKLYS